MSKGFWIGLVMAVGLLIGVFALTGGSDTSSAQRYDATKVQVTDLIYVAGKGQPTTQVELDKLLEGRIVLLEYGDFECSACANFNQGLKLLKNEYADELAVVYRHFPLTSLHTKAMAAHRAAVAAANQDISAFWSLHDQLYDLQDLWVQSSNAPAEFRQYAEDMGLDMEQYDIDVAASATFDRINSDIISSDIYAISATPSVFLNGEQVENHSYSNLKVLIDEILTES